MRTMSEAAYDDIAPELLALAKKCETLGSPGVVFYVAFDGGGGTTARLIAKAPAEARLAHYGARCNGNADLLIGSLITDGKANGHDSFYLNLLARDPGDGS